MLCSWISSPEIIVCNENIVQDSDLRYGLKSTFQQQNRAHETQAIYLHSTTTREMISMHSLSCSSLMTSGGANLIISP